MRFIGLQWLTHILYPELFPIDMARETRDFYKLFLGMDLTDQQVKEITGL
jgi:iron complex transport system substrate-binding protein